VRRALADASGKSSEHARIYREGDIWTVEFDGDCIRTRDLRGLRYLALLLRSPGLAIHSSELVEREGRGAGASAPSHRDATSEVRAERDRTAVAKALKAAISRIASLNPALGLHLAATVRSGGFCQYGPDPRHPIEWLGADRQLRGSHDRSHPDSRL
jgi:hypothetical protein